MFPMQKVDEDVDITDALLSKHDDLIIHSSQYLSEKVIKEHHHVEWTRVNEFFEQIHEYYKPRPKDWAATYRRKFTTQGFKKVSHCLFDLDGTILDSEITYHKMLRAICERYGKTYSKELQAQCYGGTDRDICTKVVEYCRLPLTAIDLESTLKEMSKKYLSESPLQKGVERLLYHLHNHRVPFALATNSTDDAVRLHEVARPKLFSLFHHKVCATDPELLRGKPYPDIYLLAMERFNEPCLRAKDCLVFEDSATGVQAARDAGMQVIIIPSSHQPTETFRNANLVLKSMQDFRPEQFGLPPFSDKKARTKSAMVKVNQ